MTMWNLRLRWSVFSFAILLCVLAGCSRKVPPPAPPTVPQPVPPPAPAVNNIPKPPLRDVAILYHSASVYADVAMQLKKLLPPETYHVTVVDVQAEGSQTRLDSLRHRQNLFTVAIGLPAA